MSNTIRSIKGTHDILPEDSKKWQQLESTIRKITHQFGYEEIRTPIFEKTGLFSRSVGEDTDIVSKEMYSWEDRDGSSLTLRPELTAPVILVPYFEENAPKKAGKDNFINVVLKLLALHTLSRMQKLYLSHIHS